jgi:hypothetical protein
MKENDMSITPMRFAPGVYELCDAANAIGEKHQHEPIILMALTMVAVIVADPVLEHRAIRAFDAYGYDLRRRPAWKPEAETATADEEAT